MSAAITSGLKGLYKIGKKDSSGKILVESDWIENLITDYGLNSGFTANFVYNYCAVGSGNTAPSFSDTQLVSPLGARSNTVTATVTGNSGSPNYYYYYRRTFEFPLSSIIGNVAEVMLCSSAGATAFSRSLVKDSGGTPITFPVLSGEQLYVIYELREYRSLGDVTGNLTINSITYPYLLRSCNVGNTNSLFSNTDVPAPPGASALTLVESAVQQPNTSEPSLAGGINAISNVVAGYTANTFYRDITYTWTPAVANFATGIGAILVKAQTATNTLKFAIYMTAAKIPKLNTQTMTVTIRWILTRV